MGLTTVKTDELRKLSMRFSTPDFIERGRVQTLSMPIYLNNDLVVPTSGTITILSNSGGEDNPILAETAVTITNGVAVYDLVAGDTSALDLSDTWVEQWELLFTVNGTEATVTFPREASLVRSRLYPVITDFDLERVHTELRDWSAQDNSDYQNFRDTAWDEIQGKLMELGNRPSLILSSYALRTAHIDLTLYYIFLDYASSANSDGKYMAVAEKYFKKFEKDFNKINFKYDIDESGLPEDKKGNVSPIVSLNVPANWTMTTGGVYSG